VALKVVTSVAETRLEVLLEPQRTGDSVAEVCRRRGISTQTFYEYRHRYLAGGLDGLEPRPRRLFILPVRSTSTWRSRSAACARTTSAGARVASAPSS
jgi:transposase-like protein